VLTGALGADLEPLVIDKLIFAYLNDTASSIGCSRCRESRWRPSSSGEPLQRSRKPSSSPSTRSACCAPTDHRAALHESIDAHVDADRSSSWRCATGLELTGVPAYKEVAIAIAKS